MKRKNGDTFTDYLGRNLITRESKLEYDSCCMECDLYDNGCTGWVKDTGDCLPTKESHVQLIFKLI